MVRVNCPNLTFHPLGTFANAAGNTVKAATPAEARSSCVGDAQYDLPQCPREPTMLPPLDIFKVQDGAYIWKAAAENFELGKSKIEQLAMQDRVEYMIFSQTTGDKTHILDGPYKKLS